MTVPFVDLHAASAGVAVAVLEEFADTIESGAFTNGPQVDRFERAFADYCLSHHCVGVASGLDALRLALMASELKPGDEVIVPAQTFVATYEAVSQAGGRPVPVDIRADDCTLDVSAARAAITTRTRVVIPVHLYGHMADMISVAEAAREHGLSVVEDACQAHGAKRDGAGPGALSTAAAFSFYPTKTLGAFGDAGAVTTNDGQLATTVTALREHGQARKNQHLVPGYTARLDTLQAVVLLHKLPHLESAIRARAAVAEWYMESLRGIGDITLPRPAANSTPSWHLFVIRTSVRDQLAAHLQEAGVQVGIHYPVVPHLTPAYKHLGIRTGSTPNAEKHSATALSLPIYPTLTNLAVEYVAASVEEFYARHRSS